MLKYTVTKEDNGKQLKSILLNRMEISKRLLNRLKSQNKILVNNSPRKTIETVNEGDKIVVDINTDLCDKTENILFQDLNLSVLYQDDYILAIDKRPHMVMHPVSGHQSGTVANGVAHLLHKAGKPTIIHPISRLDKDTSGIVLIAMNPYVQEHLIKQMKNNQFEKEYIAVVNGILKQSQGTISAPIDRVPGSIINRQVSPTGANAITHFKVIETYKNASKLRLTLETGRTHQIRVHMSHIGHPIIGDDLYFQKSELINRQALHAHRVSFIHPIKKERLDIISNLPRDILNLTDSL